MLVPISPSHQLHFVRVIPREIFCPLRYRETQQLFIGRLYNCIQTRHLFGETACNKSRSLSTSRFGQQSVRVLPNELHYTRLATRDSKLCKQCSLAGEHRSAANHLNCASLLPLTFQIQYNFQHLTTPPSILCYHCLQLRSLSSKPSSSGSI